MKILTGVTIIATVAIAGFASINVSEKTSASAPSASFGGAPPPLCPPFCPPSATRTKHPVGTAPVISPAPTPTK